MSKRNIFDQLSSIEMALHSIEEQCPGFADSVYHFDIDSDVSTVMVRDSESVYEFLDNPDNVRSWVNTSGEYFRIVHEPRDFMTFGIEGMRVFINGRKQINWVYLQEVIRDYVKRRLPNGIVYDVDNNIELVKLPELADEEYEISFWAGTYYYIYYEGDSDVFRIENFSGEVILSTEEFKELLETVLHMIKEVYK